MAALILALSSPLLAVCALACPVGMGAMMWFMGRGSRSDSSSPARSPATLDDLRDEQERLGAQIEHLEGSHADAGHTEQAEPAPEGSSDVAAAGARDTLPG